MRGTKKGVSPTPCSQLTTGQGCSPSLTCFLHIWYTYTWWGLLPELSLWGLFMQITGLGFFMFSLLPYDFRVRITLNLGLFLGEILRNVPPFELACSKTTPRKPLVRKNIAFSGVLWAEQLPACRSWGSVPVTGAVLLGLCPSHWQHFRKL